MHHHPLFVLALLAASVSGKYLRSPEWTAFDAFRVQYAKSYASVDELDARFGVFRDNFALIARHNADSTQHFALGVGPFADLTTAEFRATLGLNAVLSKTACTLAANVSSAAVPDAVDWRTNGHVTAVKDQGSCGSCWAFSATGAIESLWSIAGNGLVALSEQQLVDCSRKYGNRGCNGGLMDGAFEYVSDTGGQCAGDAYVYTAADGTCDRKCERVAQVGGCRDVTAGDQRALKQAVARAPVSVAIQADSVVFQHYAGGVLDSAECGENLNHGVLVVGYGTDADAGLNYVIVKNSWGPDWGEKGYVRIARSDARDDNGVCGFAKQASYPVI